MATAMRAGPDSGIATRRTSNEVRTLVADQPTTSQVATHSEPPRPELDDQRDVGGHRDDAEAEQQGAEGGGEEPRRAEQPEIDHRVGRAHLDRREHHQQHRAQREQRAAAGDSPCGACL